MRNFVTNHVWVKRKWVRYGVVKKPGKIQLKILIIMQITRNALNYEGEMKKNTHAGTICHTHFKSYWVYSALVQIIQMIVFLETSTVHEMRGTMYWTVYCKLTEFRNKKKREKIEYVHRPINGTVLIPLHHISTKTMCMSIAAFLIIFGSFYSRFSFCCFFFFVQIFVVNWRRIS